MLLCLVPCAQGNLLLSAARVQAALPPLRCPLHCTRIASLLLRAPAAQPAAVRRPHQVCDKGAGSALLLKPKRLEEIARAADRAMSIPLTIKTRKGYYDNNDVGGGRARAAGMHMRAGRAPHAGSPVLRLLSAHLPGLPLVPSTPEHTPHVP